MKKRYVLANAMLWAAAIIAAAALAAPSFLVLLLLPTLAVLYQLMSRPRACFQRSDLS
jgi:hypothetical protein